MPIVPQITTLALILIFSITASNCSPPTLSKKQSTPCGAIFFNSDGSVKYSGIYKEGRCVHGTKKSYRHKNNFPNPVYEIFKDGKLVKLKWLDNEDKILETVDCIKTNCN